MNANHAEINFELDRLHNLCQSQGEALNHWRKHSDLDYVTIHRMYYALEEASDMIQDLKEGFTGFNMRIEAEELLGRIEDVLQTVHPVPPKIFK